MSAAEKLKFIDADSGGGGEVFEPQQFYRPCEVAQRLSISQWTLRRRVADGTIPPPLQFKGIGPRFRGADMKRYVETGRPWRETAR